MAVRALITFALAVPALWLTLRYNMHMFQLNVYMNGEQKAWLRKNSRLQWVLVFATVLGVLRLIISPWALSLSQSGELTGGIISWIVDILIWITLAVIIAVYRIMKQMSQKKKLVFTARVKRMTATIIVLCVILNLIGFLIGRRIVLPSPLPYGYLPMGWETAYGIMGGLSAVCGTLMMSVGLQLWLNMLANTINKPIESGVRNYYINDAKRILKGSPEMTVIGVTGSYGKTSVKFFLQTLLQQKYSVLVTPESYNTPMGVVITIRKYMKPSHQIFICEMGARYVGEIKEICDIVHPDHGMITSIGPQHLDTFGSLENIQKTKFELADEVPAGAMVFLNGDNTYINDYLDKNSGRYDGKDLIFYYSDGEGSGYRASEISVSSLGTEFTVTSPDGETGRFSTRLIGAHNVINIMGAIAVANTFGISLQDLRIPVRRLRPAPHRMEMKDHGDVTIIDDAFNSNPVGSKAAVETLALFEGTRILITPGMVELGADEAEYNRKFGTYAADCCDWILLVGKKHTEPILEGALSKGFPENRCVVFDKVEDAISYAYKVKGEGHRYILLENDLPDNY
ncbi:MAG: UDP-N-acetylmuramoyl-tripeptide--D-alanyl-D-alanine ligase [Clostridiales bacterium]|nr:UDP-N-acetylmuramoyl-tripeptide--D-alanyl-D-alanine ligase [Clostridiales bacterium]